MNRHPPENPRATRSFSVGGIDINTSQGEVTEYNGHREREESKSF